MALKVLPTNNRDKNPFDTATITNADFQHIIDQGFNNMVVDPQITRVSGDIWYAQYFILPEGNVIAHITDVGIYAKYSSDIDDDDTDTGEWLYADVIFETAYNNMVDFIMNRVRPVA